MKLLYKMRDKLNDPSAHENSELKKWLILNGADTVEKFREYEINGPDKPLVFSSKLYSEDIFNFLRYHFKSQISLEI